jgi:hypothetical protein
MQEVQELWRSCGHEPGVCSGLVPSCHGHVVAGGLASAERPQCWHWGRRKLACAANVLRCSARALRSRHDWDMITNSPSIARHVGIPVCTSFSKLLTRSHLARAQEQLRHLTARCARLDPEVWLNHTPGSKLMPLRAKDVHLSHNLVRHFVRQKVQALIAVRTWQRSSRTRTLLPPPAPVPTNMPGLGMLQRSPAPLQRAQHPLSCMPVQHCTARLRRLRRPRSWTFACLPATSCHCSARAAAAPSPVARAAQAAAPRARCSRCRAPRSRH